MADEYWGEYKNDKKWGEGVTQEKGSIIQRQIRRRQAHQQKSNIVRFFSP
jgi:hypothetical protein